jgi:hypothetical protein
MFYSFGATSLVDVLGRGSQARFAIPEAEETNNQLNHAHVLPISGQPLRFCDQITAAAPMELELAPGRQVPTL